jgi:hypothetical protein
MGVPRLFTLLYTYLGDAGALLLQTHYFTPNIAVQIYRLIIGLASQPIENGLDKFVLYIDAR